MAQIQEKRLIEKSNVSMADFLRLVGEDGGSYRTLVSDIAKAVVENYSDSILYGDTQSVASALAEAKTAVDGLDSGLLDRVYPVGAIYMSVSNTNPATLFGGEWEPIQGRFLLASSNSHPNGSSDGNEEINLSVSELPPHTHHFTTGSAGYHRHTLQGARYGENYCASGSRSGVGANSAANTTLYTNYVNAHTHSGNTDSTGSGDPINIMPPYLAVNVWKRTA